MASPSPTSVSETSVGEGDLTPDSAEVQAYTSPANAKPLSISKAQLFNPDSPPEMPEVRQNAVEAAKAKQSSSQGNYDGITDILGNPFDIGVHEHDDGIPRVGANGHVRRKRGGKGGVGNKSKVDPTAGVPAPDPVLLQTQAQIKATAAVCTQLTFTLGQMIGGKEFAPIISKEHGIDEPAEFKQAWEAVCQQYNIIDIPPWAALSLVSLGYVGKRWNAPIFAKKREGWWARMKRWMFRKKDEETIRKQLERTKAEHGINRPQVDVPLHVPHPDDMEG